MNIFLNVDFIRAYHSKQERSLYRYRPYHLFFSFFLRNIKPMLINFNIRFGNINMSTDKLYITIQKRKGKCVLYSH